MRYSACTLNKLHQIILEKKMKKLIKAAGTLGLVGCAVMSSSFAATDDSFWYMGGNVGQSRAKIDDARILASLAGVGLTSSMKDDNRRTAFKLFGGYQFNRNFALEAGYFNLGQLRLYRDHGTAVSTGGNTERENQAPGPESGCGRHAAAS